MKAKINCNMKLMTLDKRMITIKINSTKSTRKRVIKTHHKTTKTINLSKVIKVNSTISTINTRRIPSL